MLLAMPDGAVTGVRVEGARTGAGTSYQGRLVNVTNRQHIRALRELGAFPVNLGGAGRGGYVCGKCEFRGYFARCGRCGTPSVRES